MNEQQIKFNKMWIRECQEKMDFAKEELKNPRLRKPNLRVELIKQCEEAIKDCLFKLYNAGIR